jgi:hypothetical protein
MSDKEHALTPEAVELLLAAVRGGGNQHGLVFAAWHYQGFILYAGGRDDFIPRGDMRAQAKFLGALGLLEDCGLVERESGSLLRVTDSGYLAADEVRAGSR